MIILRAMTYALEGCGEDHLAEIGRIIHEQRPDLVFLQHLKAGQLKVLSEASGLHSVSLEEQTAFLSRHPLKGLRSYSLEGSGQCLQADLDLSGKRVHLFNVQLDCDPGLRAKQLANLFGADILSNLLPCAILVAGDFSVPLLGAGQWLLRRKLTQAQFAGRQTNYPANFPLWARDRFYLRGPIKSLAGQVVSTPASRKIARHLPLVVSFELTDTREYLKVPKVQEKQMRPVVG
jgi:endonuclease/exonuclease/phosphatase family metal-dependent hydrolase